jgi:uncharacterized protein (TIGR00295 family)
MKMDEKEAVALLKKYAPDTKTFQIVYQHGKAVQNAALVIAKEIHEQGHTVDLDVIAVGSILHDIGRFWYPPGKKDEIKHGVKGAEILRKEGHCQLARIAERHIGVGLTKEEIRRQHLPLPEKDFVPETIEEKIITYADNLIAGDRIATVREVIEHYRQFGPRSLKRAIALHNEIERLRGGEEAL